MALPRPRHLKKSLDYAFQERNYAVEALDYLEGDVRFVARRWPAAGLDFEDVEQELRMHLWNKIHLYDPTKAGLRAWAGLVMRNRIKDIMKRGTDPLEVGVTAVPDWI